MTTKLNSNELQKAIEEVEKVKVKKEKYSVSILESINFNLENENLVLSKTNHDLTIFKTIENVKNDSGFNFLINNPKQLLKVLKLQKNKDLMINVDENYSLNIVNEKKHTFKLMGSSIEDFPEIEKEIEGTKIVMNAEEFRKQISSILYSASTDTIKPVFNSVFLNYENEEYLSLKESSLVAVTTDSRRLSKVNMPIHSINIQDEIKSCMVPLQSMKVCIDLLKKKSAEQITLIFNKDYIKIIIDSSLFLISKTIEGQFPNYKQVIPSNFQTEINVISKKEILEGLQSIVLFTREPAFKIVMESENNFIKFYADSEGLGYADFKIKHEVENVEKTILGMNANYLIETIKNLDSDFISIKINEARSPVLISGNNNNPIAIIMPIQIKCS